MMVDGPISRKDDVIILTANGIAESGVFWRRSLTTEDEIERKLVDILTKRQTPPHAQTHDTDFRL